MSESLEQLQKLAEERQQLGVLSERKHVQDLTNTLMENMAESSASAGTKRTSSRLCAQRTKIIKPTARDNIYIPGIEGTLGSNILHLCNIYEIIDKKSRYFSLLSKNSVLDLSVTSFESHINTLGGKKVQDYIKQKYGYTIEEQGQKPIIINYEKFVKGAKNPKTIEGALEQVEQYQTSRSDIQIKRIYIDILERHLIHSYSLSDAYLKKCSEQSTIIKFWSYLFEQFFSKKSLFVQWGDTVSPECKRLTLDFKLDIRFISEAEKGFIDITNGEFAKFHAATKSKYYNDKLKAVLAAKCHLNHIIESSPGISVASLKALKIPIVLVMGLNFRSISYPRTYFEVSHGGIASILDGFALIEGIIDDTITIYDQYSRNTEDIITKIDKKGNARKTIDIDEWLSPVLLDVDDNYENYDPSDDSDDLDIENDI
ncbi:hypothetical protein INT48_002068 [Thamnidium elegans]|uniref:Uncharacterized protein n=1 Tax=Thamnidium elegans TaxID=101142 RepID=A0A8H7VWI4_9FUNG|nr:hypothetical protein INT48_002068 [Thamnidium elegans]